jgi:G1/S-specific cyclin-E1
MQRETFYLAVDFLDRFLGITSNLEKNRFQLLGVTCLFIAAKVEEIYPPKVKEFAYVTGNAKTEINLLDDLYRKNKSWACYWEHFVFR